MKGEKIMSVQTRPGKLYIEENPLEPKENVLGIASQVEVNSKEKGGTKIVMCCSCGGCGSATIKDEEDIVL